MLRRTSEISFTTQSSQTHHHAHNQLVYSQSDFLSRNSDFRNTRTQLGRYNTNHSLHAWVPSCRRFILWFLPADMFAL